VVKEKRVSGKLAAGIVLGMTNHWCGAIIDGSPANFYMKSKLKKVFGKDKNILIGMIHLPPLLSIQGFSGMQNAIAKALADLTALQKAGFDAVLIENDNDKPHTEFANSAQVASFTAIATEVCKQATIPVGVQMMLNDWKASFEIAKVVGAVFTRLDVFVDHITCEWCEINPTPAKIMAYKNKIYLELLLLADIQVKYKKMVKPRPLTASAKLAIKHGADALVITGTATGVETPIEKLQEVRKAYPHIPLFVGAGVSAKNVKEQLAIANGAIVGTSIKTQERIDVRKAKVLAKEIS
jgi:membrane complex biogenesis BtpA family protein